jgi:hypothetical protein
MAIGTSHHYLESFVGEFNSRLGQISLLVVTYQEITEEYFAFLGLIHSDLHLYLQD